MARPMPLGTFGGGDGAGLMEERRPPCAECGHSHDSHVKYDDAGQLVTGACRRRLRLGKGCTCAEYAEGSF